MGTMSRFYLSHQNRASIECGVAFRIKKAERASESRSARRGQSLPEHRTRIRKNPETPNASLLYSERQKVGTWIWDDWC